MYFLGLSSLVAEDRAVSGKLACQEGTLISGCRLLLKNLKNETLVNFRKFIKFLGRNLREVARAVSREWVPLNC